MYFFSFEVHVLQEKWREFFDIEDVNNDSVLDLADSELCKDNYIRLHNLTTEEVYVQKVFKCKTRKSWCRVTAELTTPENHVELQIRRVKE